MLKVGSEKWCDIILQATQRLGISVTAAQCRLFGQHALELLRFNRKTNLTAITDPLEVAIKHFVDSVVATAHVQPDARIVDIGSGGGFPGLPMKVLLPELDLTLIEAARRKASFLGHVTRMLGFTGVSVHHGRVPNLDPSHIFSRAYDAVVCRAVAETDEILQLAAPMLAPAGKMVLLKGPGYLSELHSWRQEGDDDFRRENWRCHVHHYRLDRYHWQRSVLTVSPDR